MHAPDGDIKAIYELLTSLGVVARDNPFKGKDYPYTPQGLCAIELVDG
jgi:hypothetical protein